MERPHQEEAGETRPCTLTCNIHDLFFFIDTDSFAHFWPLSLLLVLKGVPGIHPIPNVSQTSTPLGFPLKLEFPQASQLSAPLSLWWMTLSSLVASMHWIILTVCGSPCCCKSPVAPLCGPYHWD